MFDGTGGGLSRIPFKDGRILEYGKKAAHDYLKTMD
jgi:hypothetical protein